MNARRLHYCRECSTATAQTFMSREGEPPAEYWVCSRCGLVLLTLGDVLDAEGFCRVALRRALSKRAFTDYGDSQSFDFEERLADLQAELWNCYRRWDPTVVRFRAYATWILARRIIDFDRRKNGRNGSKPLTHAVSLDAVSDDGYECAADRLDAALGGRAVDDGVRSLTDLRWVVAQRSGDLARVSDRLRARGGRVGRAVAGVA